MPGTPGPTTTTGQQTLNDRNVIQDAANSAGIPFYILWGVYGAESSFGQAYKPGGSAAGQPTYGYFGLTSPGLWNSSMSFSQDATTAANLLAKLYKSHGNNWDAALTAYSGGGYGLAHVTQLAGANKGSNQITNIPNDVTSVANAVTAPISAAESIASLVTSGSFWLRILEGIGAIVLLVLGLRALSGGDGNPVTVVSGGAKKVAKGAAVAAAA